MIILHFDGSCVLWRSARGGWVIRQSEGGSPIYGFTGPLSPDEATCNAAEYAGLAGGLADVMKRYGPSNIMVYGDSKLVINQMSGLYQVKPVNGPKLKPYVPFYYAAKHAASDHKWIGWTWIPREQNYEADRASRMS